MYSHVSVPWHPLPRQHLQGRVLLGLFPLPGHGVTPISGWRLVTHQHLPRAEDEDSSCCRIILMSRVRTWAMTTSCRKRLACEAVSLALLIALEILWDVDLNRPKFVFFMGSKNPMTLLIRRLSMKLCRAFSPMVKAECMSLRMSWRGICLVDKLTISPGKNGFPYSVNTLEMDSRSCLSRVRRCCMESLWRVYDASWERPARSRQAPAAFVDSWAVNTQRSIAPGLREKPVIPPGVLLSRLKVCSMVWSTGIFAKGLVERAATKSPACGASCAA